MPSKGLSSRLQGLKFMQRASARDELKDTKPSPASSKANFPAEGMSGDETEAKDVSRNAEHWVVPVNMRVKTKSVQRDTWNWDSWFQKATETDFVPARQQFGSWKGRRNQDDDEFEEDVCGKKMTQPHTQSSQIVKKKVFKTPNNCRRQIRKNLPVTRACHVCVCLLVDVDL